MSAAGNADAGELPIAIVVVCATADAKAITSTFSSLAAAGISPRAVGGVEAEDRPMTEALSKAAAATVFVVVSSAELRPDRVRRLVECFTAYRGPAHRLLVLDFMPGRAHGLLSPIRRAAGSLRRQLQPGANKPPLSRGRPRLRVVPSPPPSRPKPRPSEPKAAPPSPAETRQLAVVEPDSTPAADSLQALIDRNAFASAQTVQLPQVIPPPPAPPRRRLQKLMTAGAWAIAGVWAIAAFESIDAPKPPQARAVAPVELPHALRPAAPAEPPPPSPPVATDVPATTPPPPSYDESPSPIEEAIVAGKLHELDLLLATAPYPDATDWWRAANRCKARSVLGVRGFRLPKPAELRRLRRANFVPDGTYWTMARVLDSETPSNWTFDTKIGAMTPAPKTHSAQTLCVRKR